MTDPRIKTARSAGCIGANAIVPRIAHEMYLPGDQQLDFGCGPEALHVKCARMEGMNVVGYDLAFDGASSAAWNQMILEGRFMWTWVLHDRTGRFDLVYASNVINVQETETDLWRTCNALRIAAGWGHAPDHPRTEAPCPILLNYPSSPRKLGWKMKKMKDYLVNVGLGAEFETIKPGVMLFRPPSR